MSSRENSFADHVFKNGSIYTVDKKRPWAQAVAVREGEIVYVGDDQGVETVTGPGTRIVDLNGKMMLPGFHDVHVHLYDGGMHSLQCDLWDCQSPEAVLECIGKYIHDQGPDADGWIQCSGLQKNCTDSVTRETLDALASQRPLYILTFDGHSCLANSKALALAGIDKDMPDPPGGRIERIPGSNEPNGYLHDFAARMVKEAIPLPSLEERLCRVEKWDGDGPLLRDHIHHRTRCRRRLDGTLS